MRSTQQFVAMLLLMLMVELSWIQSFCIRKTSFAYDDLFPHFQVTEVGLQKDQLETSVDVQIDSKLEEGQRFNQEKSVIKGTHNTSNLRGLVNTNDFPIDGARL